MCRAGTHEDDRISREVLLVAICGACRTLATLGILLAARAGVAQHVPEAFLVPERVRWSLDASTEMPPDVSSDVLADAVQRQPDGNLRQALTLDEAVRQSQQGREGPATGGGDARRSPETAHHVAASRNELRRRRLWESSEMLAARQWVADYYRLSRRHDRAEGRRYLAELERMPAHRLEAWLDQFSEMRAVRQAEHVSLEQAGKVYSARQQRHMELVAQATADAALRADQRLRNDSRALAVPLRPTKPLTVFTRPGRRTGVVVPGARRCQ